MFKYLDKISKKAEKVNVKENEAIKRKNRELLH